ncbi:MAG TPA: universal stress protein [Noviherbaspirillum sp.]|uniref:universal stress protein n=1 Tax=Noviherbaspirillum sp. TaxID=1926288 RepID=UPI002B49ACFA|nr:universal stress protein [Noviherbaspirillum sp.]HJV85133.1 universal stress protein [Noviherbaspirillum sp.]
MFKTILVPTDGSANSERAIKTAIDFARQVDGKVIGLAVAEPYPFSPIAESAYIGGSEAFEQRSLEVAKGHVSMIATAATAAGVPCETIVAQSENPHEEIVDTAQRLHCDAIFMGTHGRKGLSRLFAGSVTQKVIASSPVPVTVIR